MKNIQVIPTDKPSKLLLSGFGTLFLTPPMEFKSSDKYQYIYITSDENIKEGDWYIDDANQIRKSITSITSDKQYWAVRQDYKKIILTTDQDLIADGVQAIDNEFLKWFVKNPSCDNVEIKISRYRHYYKTGEIMTSLSPTPDFSSRNMQCEKVQPIYKIIIPQEEPKQKTLEEAAEKYAHNYFEMHSNHYKGLNEGFIAGAKYQAEKMYSEEEVIVIVEKSRETGLTAEYLLLTEQFKKK